MQELDYMGDSPPTVSRCHSHGWTHGDPEIRVLQTRLEGKSES